MKRLALFLTILSTILSVAIANADSASPVPLRIGAIASLTGDAAKDGRNWLDGAKLAVDTLRQRGRQVELIVEDDGTAPGRTASAFVKLARVDGVQGIVGGTWDFLADTACPLAKEHKVLFATPTNPPELMLRCVKDNPWVLTNGLSLAAERDTIRKFLIEREVKSIALLYINVPYGTSHAALLRDLAKELSIAVVADDEYSYEGYQDAIRLSAVHAAQRKPDLVFAVTNYEGADVFMRELRRVHAAPAVLMTHALRAALEFTADPTLYSHAFGIMQSFKDETFSRDFTAKFAGPPHDYAAPGYDAVMFLAEILSKPAAPGVAVKYDGITGVHHWPANDGMVVNTTAGIFAFRDGAVRQVMGAPMTEIRGDAIR